MTCRRASTVTAGALAEMSSLFVKVCWLSDVAMPPDSRQVLDLQVDCALQSQVVDLQEEERVFGKSETCRASGGKAARRVAKPRIGLA